MKTILLLLLAMASISTAAWATEATGSSGTTEPEAMNVHQTDACIASTLLDDVQRITFSDDGTIMTIVETNETTQEFTLVTIQYVAFGTYIYQDNKPTNIEPYIAYPDDVHKVLDNGNLIIIKNGIRYNVLGVQL